MGKTAITVSSIRAFQTCRVKFKYSYIDRLTKKDQPSYFKVGDALHQALENHYQGMNTPDIVNLIRRYFELKTPNDSDKEAKWKEDEYLAIQLFHRYIDHYPIEKEPFNTVATEEKFKVPIVNPNTGAVSKKYEFQGKIDSIVYMDGGFWIKEIKTTSSLNESYRQGIRLNMQTLAYVDSIERATGQTFRGALYDVIFKSIPVPPKHLKPNKKNPGIRLSVAKNQNTTYQLFKAEIENHNLDENDYKDHLEYLKKKNKLFFYREKIEYTAQEKRAWRMHLWNITKDIHNTSKNSCFYPNTDSCSVYGTCTMYDICTSSNKEFTISTSYRLKAHRHEELAVAVVQAPPDQAAPIPLTATQIPAAQKETA